MPDWLSGGLELHLAASRVSAWWFLPFAVPVSLQAIWSDLSAMRIPNRGVLILAAGFLLTGLFALSLPEYGWRIAQGVIVLVIGFILNQFGGIGAGDVKYAAAAAPLIAPGDGEALLILFAAALIASFGVHRLARMVPAIRRATPGWVSWQRADFPMGIALGTTLILYLVLVAVYGR